MEIYSKHTKITPKSIKTIIRTNEIIEKKICDNCGLDVELCQEDDNITEFGLSRKENFCHTCYYLYQDVEYKELEKRKNMYSLIKINRIYHKNKHKKIKYLKILFISFF